MSLNVIMKLRQILNKAKPNFRAREMLSGKAHIDNHVLI